MFGTVLAGGTRERVEGGWTTDSHLAAGCASLTFFTWLLIFDGFEGKLWWLLHTYLIVFSKIDLSSLMAPEGGATSSTCGGATSSGGGGALQ